MNRAVRLQKFKIERHVVGKGRRKIVLNCSRKTSRVGTLYENIAVYWPIVCKTKLNLKTLAVEVPTEFIWPGRDL